MPETTETDGGLMNCTRVSKHAANYVSVFNTGVVVCGGAFISQWQRWRGVFAPARANENKLFTVFCGIRFVCGRTMQANYVGELCGTNCIGEPYLNYV